MNYTAELSIADFANPIPGLDPSTSCDRLGPLFAQNKCSSLVVVQNQRPIGLLTYRHVKDATSTQYGYALYQKHPVTDLMVVDFLYVEASVTFSEIVNQALEREQESLYEDIVVVSGGNYIGLLSIARVLSEQRRRISFQMNRLQEQQALLEETNRILNQAFEDLKAKENQIIQSEKLAGIGTLASGIAHDFNNMLTAIISSNHMLKSKIAEDSPIQKYCTMIESAANRSASLTRQLLDFSQKSPVTFMRVSMNRIIEETVHLLERSIGKNIAIKIDTDDSIAMIIGDETQLQQIMMNLSLNARDAMPNGGILKLGTRFQVADEEYCKIHSSMKQGSYVRFFVEDTGTGIPPDALPKIFDPFFTTKDIGKGTGLGLSVVYGIVQRHHGFIEVLSTVGKGTRFDVYFPSVSLRNSISTGQEQHYKSPTFGCGTILLVDDEKAVLDINGEYLESLGYSVLKAHSGDEAIAQLQRYGSTIQLIVLDMLMPGKDGRETFRLLKQMNPKVRVAFVSGFSDEHHFADVMKEGALAWFKKPIPLSFFSQKINEMINSSEPIVRRIAADFNTTEAEGETPTNAWFRRRLEPGRPFGGA